jgi:hypothetical protein
MLTAVKVEGFRLRNEMKKEINEGAPGGRKFKALTYLARGLNIRTSRKIRMDRPLIRLANAVFYEVRSQTLNDFESAVGFKSKRTIPFLRRMAKLHQEGFQRPIKPALRRLIIKEGGRRGKIEGENTPFFIKKTTKAFRTPARPIIDPFWDKHRTEALVNIRNNFRQKMRGKRI